MAVAEVACPHCGNLALANVESGEQVVDILDTRPPSEDNPFRRSDEPRHLRVRGLLEK